MFNHECLLHFKTRTQTDTSCKKIFLIHWECYVHVYKYLNIVKQLLRVFLLFHSQNMVIIMTLVMYNMISFTNVFLQSKWKTPTIKQNTLNHLLFTNKIWYNICMNFKWKMTQRHKLMSRKQQGNFVNGNTGRCSSKIKEIKNHSR